MSVAVRPSDPVRTGVAGWADRAAAAVPVALVFVFAAFVHGWHAWATATPWLFSDELEYTQLARAIAESGTPARRGVEHGASLYPYAIAPAWWISDTETAYNTAKFIGALLMSSAALPAYALARMLVGKGPALLAALATVSIPAFMYADLLIQEPLAYPVATLALYLGVRALTTRRRLDFALAIVVALLAAAARGQLAVILPILALAAATIAWHGERARRARAAWSTWDKVGAAVLAVGFAVVVNAVLSHGSQAWEISTRLYKDRILEHALWAFGAFAIGIGLLPLVAAVAALLAPQARRLGPAALPFAAVLGWSIAVFGLYTGVKGAFLSTVFATRVAERNLIYLAPLVFIATAVWLHRSRLRVGAIAAATALVAVALAVTPLYLEYPYFEAPGFSIAALANRSVELPAETIEDGLYWALAGAGALLVATALLAGRPRLRLAVVGSAAALVLAWNAAGLYAAADGSQVTAEAFRANLPDPPTWVDEATGGEGAVYVAQNVKDPTGIWSHEFWNRSIDLVWSLDGTAPGPGPTLTPDLVRADGQLSPDPGVEFAVVEGPVDLQGTTVATMGTVRVVRLDEGLKVRSSIEGVFPDGWTGPTSAYSVFSDERGRPGTVEVTLSRQGGGPPEPAAVEVVAGPLVVSPEREPALGRVAARRTTTIAAGEVTTVEVPTSAPPFRIEVLVTPTFVPAKIGGSGDTRELGAQIAYAYRPASR